MEKLYDAFCYMGDHFFYAPWLDDYYILLTLVRGQHSMSRLMPLHTFEADKAMRCGKMIEQLNSYEEGKASVAETFAH